MKLFFTSLSLLLVSLFAKAQTGLYEQYIEQYKGLAIQQMNRHGIPASITLAQGLLESGAGTSLLAQKANNHFGIKVGGTWTGPYMLRDDDSRGEKFRVYASPEHSYEDHSLFLTTRPRYASLFRLDKTDYKGWAHGLKAAGYATNPRYAHSLISIIERYDLSRFDGAGAAARATYSPASPAPAAAVAAMDVKCCNDVLYVVAREGDSFASLSGRLGIKEKKLRRYNEVGDDYTLARGDVVFIEKKKTKAAPALEGKYHTVAAGESLHSISQRYALRLSALYGLNELPADYAVKVGDRLRLR